MNRLRPLIRPDCHFLRRLGVGFIVCIWILAPYFLLQQFSLYQVYWLEGSWLDRQIPLNLQAVYIYFTYCLLLALAGFATSPQVFVRFVRAVCMVALVSHLCFFFFPTGVSREAISMEGAPRLYEWMVKLEKPRNCLPSLHASLATLAMFALWKRSSLCGGMAILWWGAILWSTIALRQHVILDLVSGIILATGVWFFFGKRSNGAKVEEKIGLQSANS